MHNDYLKLVLSLHHARLVSWWLALAWTLVLALALSEGCQKQSQPYSYWLNSNLILSSINLGQFKQEIRGNPISKVDG